MYSQINPQSDSTFVLRRLLELMPWPSLFFPVALGLGVLFMLVLFRSKKRLKTLAVWTPLILLAGALYVGVGYSLVGLLSWWLVLVPTLAIAFFYVGMMYFKDAHTVHFTWAGFLGMLRACVYVLLGVCFLLPGCQEYITTETESKVIVLFDVSASMNEAPDGSEGEGGATRQEKVLRFLTTPFVQHGQNKTFIEHLQTASSVACYRFGGGIDDEFVLFEQGGKGWSVDQWKKWLHPDKNDIVAPDKIVGEQARQEYVASRRALYDQLRDATDVGGSALQVVQRESANRIQAIFVVSDGNSNRGDEEAIQQLLERAASPKRPINVVTVGVGSFKQPVRIRINPLITPASIRVDDAPFDVRVPIFGDGLPGQEVQVTLYAQRITAGDGTKVQNEPEIPIETKKAKFGGGGEFPFDEVVFKVDMPDVYWVYYKKVHRDPKAEIDETTKSKIKGDWKFFVKVPRHPDEAKKEDEKVHVSAPKIISINDNRLNVLLFASGPSRDYQFVRVMLAREVEANRASMSIYLQASKGLDEVQQDVDNSRLLPDFPTRLERPKSGKDGEKGELQGDPMNLKSYDVIIAFDPDCRDLKDYQLKLVKDWVEGDHGGGLIFVAGPQNTQRLIPPMPEKMNTWDLKSIYALFPVILARPLPNLSGDSMHDTTIPYFLKFTGIAKGFDFLKLDDESPSPLGGWDKFFGKLVQEDFPGGVTKTHPERGFYNYHLVQKAKPGAEILATFDDPKSPKTEDGKEQPYFVTMRAGKGKTFYIGSGEMWRLRTFNEEYHQRFWMKLARYISAVSGGKSFGRFSMAAEFVTGAVPIEAEVMDKDGYPQSENAPPIVIVRRVNGKEIKPGQDSIQLVLKAKQTRGAVKGIFAGTAQIEDEGAYVAQIDIAGTKESIKQTFDVRRPDIELTDLRTDFPKLYNMATDAPAALLAKMTDEGREHLEHGRDRPEGGGDVKFQVIPSARMFYRLRSAELASQCIMRVPPEKDRINGSLKNIWDAGPQVFNARKWADVPGLAVTMFVLPAVVLGLVMALMLIGGRWLAALGVAGVLAAIEGGMWWVVEKTLPVDVFQPSLYGVLLVVPPLILLTAMGILLIAERYRWVLMLLGAAALYIVAVVLVNAIYQPEWQPLKVDFTWMLLLIAGLLSLEWFTRKMLRLA